ncbi:C2H2 domain-containing protein [Lentithecium fluviatile CBS 122367]|uniref:C2H2 domain-containing protein n=1 Tax=Lentithecium fluviatile CBS 122367 TaxID=1168545 RepID=A0A6G1IPM8_9PLEO|nr:C2H2 domain-containing protein [Lentithecium fluviatile CBS 122367]
MDYNSSVSDLPSSQASRVSTGLTGTLSSQSTLVGAPTQSGDAFRQAVIKFKSRLSGERLTEFKSTTYELLVHEIMRIQHEQESKKNMMNFSRIQSCLEAMHQFGKTIEVFLNVSDAVAFVWGPIKFLLLTASNFTDSFDVLLDAYEQIGEQLPLLQEYEDLFHHSPHMIQALVLMYIDILEFHQNAIRFFSGKLWRRFFRSMWKDFGTKFSGILKSLSRHRSLVESRASLAQYRLYREDIANMRSGLDRLITEEQNKKMKAVREWLAVGSQSQEDHDACCQIRKEFPSTGRWILKHEFVKDWMAVDNPPTPIVWLTGIPGAGKTILASTIIEECKQQDSFITGYFYCHYEGQGTNTAVGVLRGLIDQLLAQYPQLLPPCHTKHSTSGEPSLRSLSLAKQLFENFCSTVSKLFIIVDGLDECEHYERKQLIDTFLEVVTTCEADEPGKLRVLFVSQDYADIRKGIEKLVPRIVALSTDNILNERDIQTFVRSRVDSIAKKYAPFTDDTAEYLRNLTMARANGMFLYAKLVMDNLCHQPTREDLLDAIRHENFPHGLKEAYERIVSRIRRDHIEEWPTAAKLLGWMVCAKRQLNWREIQVALSLDLDNQCVEYDDRRLRKHIYEICGSLVQVHGDSVFLVHSTAKYYVANCTEDIHQPSVECELAALCLQYLTFDCFLPDDKIEKHALREKMLEGQFAFQDYAVAKWFHHVNAFVNCGKDLHDSPHAYERLLELSRAVDEFLARYCDENFHDSIVNECKENCKDFQDQDFYDDLVALTSHIYMFQKKGFEARHKISIKSLKTVLERNRKLLEELPPKLGPSDLDNFRKFYDDERRFKCTQITCNYFSEGFKDAKSRKQHVNHHSRPYRCEVPDCLGAEGFANSKDLEKHTRSFHPEISDLAERFNNVVAKRAKATFTCSICGKSFTRKLIQFDHEKSHRGERDHECPECGKAFTRKNDLTRHRKLHDRK